MTRLEIYKDLLAKAANPDTAPDALQSILEMVETDSVAIDNLTKTNTENEAKIKELQDTNIKLFLAQVKPEEKHEDEEKKPLSFDDFSKNL